MTQAGGYREELESELKQTDPNSHANRLIAQEIERLTKGDDETGNNKKEKPAVPLLEIHNDRPQKISAKVRIPVREHPRYNFVGKLLGPKGQTLKALQEQTGCKMAIMGRGSMREKDKEEELRKEGGKYAHLNEDLHVLVDCFTEATDGYHRLAAGLAEIRKFLIPELAEGDMYGGGDMGMGEMGMNGGGAPRGRGSFRGGPPPERGARGGFRGRGAGGPPGGPGGVPPPSGRGAPPSGRGGAPPQRGAPRGAPAGRGAPPSRGARAAAPPPAAPSYDYNSQGYGSGGYNSQYDGSYDDGYSQSRGGGAESSYYDYGASSSASGYDSYSGGGGGYGDYGDGYQAKAAPPPSSRGAARPPARAHPYARPAQGGY